MIRIVSLIVLSLLSWSVIAEPYSGGIKMADASSIWRVFLALAFLIVLIPLVILGLKRLQGLQHKFSKSEIQIIATQSLGTKEKLVLVEVQGKRLLLGVTAQNITCLNELEANGNQFAELMNEQLANEK